MDLVMDLAQLCQYAAHKWNGYEYLHHYTKDNNLTVPASFPEHPHHQTHPHYLTTQIF